VDKDDIVADFFDAIPRDQKVVLAAKHAEEPTRPRHEYRNQAAFHNVDYHIMDKTEPMSAMYVYDLFAAKVNESAIH